MAGRDRGRTDDGETTAAGTGFRFDATDDATDGQAAGRDRDGAAGVAARGGNGSPDGTPDAGGNGERARDERAREALNERLSAVERAMTGTDAGPADLSDAAAREERLDELADRIDDVEARVAELEGGLQAVRGYVGDLRAVNRDVERRADAALAATRDEGARVDDDERPERTSERRLPDGRERERDAGDDRADADPSDSSGLSRPDRCEHCGRAGRVPGRSDGHDGVAPPADADVAAGEREPEGGRTGRDRVDAERRDRESTPAGGGTVSGPDREPEPAPGMGADLDARADGYRPPAVDLTDEEDEDDGPLARLRDAL